MAVKVVGESPKTKRIITGLKTFDSAFENVRGDIGFPIGTMVEIFGPTGCGKSTLITRIINYFNRSVPCHLSLHLNTCFCRTAELLPISNNS